MATWQADFELLPPPAGMPETFRAHLARLLPPGRSWHEELEVWGSDDGHRLDVWRGGVDGISARIDIRAADVQFLERFLEVVRALGCELRNESDQPVAPVLGEFALALRGSPAFRFVQDPELYLRRLQLGGLEDA